MPCCSSREMSRRWSRALPLFQPLSSAFNGLHMPPKHTSAPRMRRLGPNYATLTCTFGASIPFQHSLPSSPLPITARHPTAKLRTEQEQRKKRGSLPYWHHCSRGGLVRLWQSQSDRTIGLADHHTVPWVSNQHTFVKNRMGTSRAGSQWQGLSHWDEARHRRPLRCRPAVSPQVLCITRFKQSTAQHSNPNSTPGDNRVW
jgi:hypothetical protein